MRFPWLILIYLIFPFAAVAQGGSITGIVTNADSKAPIPKASVFLSNSSIGTATNEDGKFFLNGVRPGEYTLVVSILGYEDYSKSVIVGSEPIKLDVQLTQKPLMLREVVISSNADWKRNYEVFKKDFIGTDENAKYCDVVNPHVINLTYNPTKQILHADADEFLIVENRALGYRIKYLLQDFSDDKINGIISFLGQRLFEDLPGSEAQKKKWHEKREEAYYGSPMHFYRSLYTGKLADDGFVIYSFIRYPNPMRPKEEVIKQKIKQFSEFGSRDSLKYWYDTENMSKYYMESLEKPALEDFEVWSRDTQPGLFVLHFPHYLYVVYTKKRDEVDNKDLYRPLDMPNYEVSIITPMNGYPVFDMNGIVVDNAPLYEGAWSRDRLSDMLPVNYVPDQK